MWGKQYILIKKIFYILAIISMILSMVIKVANAQICTEENAPATWDEGNPYVDPNCQHLFYPSRPEATAAYQAFDKTNYHGQWIGNVSGCYYATGKVVAHSPGTECIQWWGYLPPCDDQPHECDDDCGDEQCLGTETPETCIEDCGYCGDEICADFVGVLEDHYEDALSCPQDCHDEDDSWRKKWITVDGDGNVVEATVQDCDTGDLITYGDDDHGNCIASGECDGQSYVQTDDGCRDYDELGPYLDSLFGESGPHNEGPIGEGNEGPEQETHGGNDEGDMTDGEGNDGNTEQLDYLADIVQNTQENLENQQRIRDNLINLERSANIAESRRLEQIQELRTTREEIVDKLGDVESAINNINTSGGGTDVSGVEAGIGETNDKLTSLQGTVDGQTTLFGEIRDKQEETKIAIDDLTAAQELERQQAENAEQGIINSMGDPTSTIQGAGQVDPNVISSIQGAEGNVQGMVNEILTENPVAIAITESTVDTSGGLCSFTWDYNGTPIEFSICSFQDELNLWGTIMLGMAGILSIMIVFRR